MKYALSIVLLMCSGCTSAMLKDKASEANVLSGAYLKQIDKTTPEQDKAHIRAMDAEILQFDAAVNGTVKAAQTRALVK
jgi:hypothetical protein